MYILHEARKVNRDVTIDDIEKCFNDDSDYIEDFKNDLIAFKNSADEFISIASHLNENINNFLGDALSRNIKNNDKQAGSILKDLDEAVDIQDDVIKEWKETINRLKHMRIALVKTINSNADSLRLKEEYDPSAPDPYHVYLYWSIVKGNAEKHYLPALKRMRVYFTGKFPILNAYQEELLWPIDEGRVNSLISSFGEMMNLIERLS